MNKKANSLIKKKLTKYNTQKRKYKSLSNGNLTERSAFWGTKLLSRELRHFACIIFGSWTNINHPPEITFCALAG